MTTHGSTNMLTTISRCGLALALAALVVACGGKAPTDAMDAAQAAVDGAAESERCAESEFRAARNLLEQAQQAYADREWDRARQLAEAAEAQAARANEMAAANAEDCERVNEMTDQLGDDDGGGEQTARNSAQHTDYTLDRIYFPFNQSNLTDEARTTLGRHAEYLAANPDIEIIVEGHCDERGSTEYNLALGERRARAVADYLQRLGVDSDRMRPVSFGEELPLGADNDRNRRAEFVVQ